MDTKLKRITFGKCPEGLRFPATIRHQEQFDVDKGPCLSNLLTEQKAQYCIPAKNPKIVTRESRLEQFWWHAFYEEYLRSVERNIKSHPMPNSEYTDNYTKELRKSSNDELMDKFPLYSSNSISFYNQDGNKLCNFRRSYTITKPVYLQDQQFG